MTEDNAPAPIDPIPVSPATAPVAATPPSTAVPPVADYATTSPAGPGFVDAARAGWAATAPTEKTLLMAAAGAAGVLAIGTLLTWVNVFVASVSGVSTGPGKASLLIAIASVVVIAAVMAKKLPAALTWRASAATFLGVAVWLLVLAFRFHRSFSGMDAMDGMTGPGSEIAGVIKGSVGIGIGLYVSILAALAAAAAYSVIAAPTLAQFKVPADPKPIGIALGIGAAAGLLIGVIS